MENSFFIAIAVLSCILGAEIAGICILINKVLRARREKQQREYEEQFLGKYEEESDGKSYLLIPVVGAAVSVPVQLALLVLAICVAVGAVVFTLLLVIFRARGYSLVSPKDLKASVVENDAEEQVYIEPAVADEEMPEETEVLVAEESFQEPESLVAVEAPEEAPEAEESLPVDDEEPEAIEEEAEEETEEAPAFEEPLVASEELAPEAEAEAEAEAPSVPAPIVRPTDTPVAYGQAASGAIPVYSSVYPGGQMPIIEKHITETYKEVIKETNTTTTTNNAPAPKAEEKYSPATEEILKAIAELMKLGTQIRMEKELAVENPSVQSEESTALLSEAEEDAEDELEREDEDTEDVEDAADENAGEGDDDYESDLFSSSGRIVGFDEETGCYIVAHYRKSFEAKLIQARPEVKKYYSEIKNALLSYEGTKDRISWTINSYNNEHTPIAKINVRTRTLDLYLALDPASLEDSVYHGKDVGAKKKYADTPFLYKVNSPRKLTLALELVQRASEEQGLSPIDIEAVNYEEQYPFQTTEDLVAKGLIREYLREEKPAVTFELDPDHVPEVPAEDESVIPANANFTWEFDNEEMEKEAVAEPAPEPVAEPEPEPVVEEAPVTEPEEAIPASTTTTTTHETVKTTERHYTETYYGIPGQAPQQMTMLTEKPPIEALAVPAEETAEETVVEAPVVEEPVIEEPVVEEAADESVIEAVTEEEELSWNPIEGVLGVELDETDSTEEVIDEGFEEELEAELDVELADAELEEEIEEIEEELIEDETEEEPIEDETEEELVEDETEEEFVEDEIEEEPIEDETEEELVEDETEEEIIEDEIEEEFVEDEIEEELVEDETEEEVTEDDYEEEYEESDLEEPDVIEEIEEEAEETREEAEETEEEEQEAPTPAPQPIPSANPSVALLDVCLFDDYFENGAIVNLETLKQVGLVAETATKLKVYATGPVKGQFTVEANHFTLDAIKSIGDADGDSIMIR